MFLRAGDTYHGKWDPKTCTGNPCNAAIVVDMLEACINKSNETDERNHSRAMSYQDMQKLMDWTGEKLKAARAAGNIGEIGRWLSIRAFASTGFTIWTR